MDTLTLILALAALVLALRAQGRKAPPPGEGLDDLRREARRRVEDLEGELRAEITTLRRQLAATVAGSPPSAEQVLEGRLWRDVDGREAAALLEGEVYVLDVRTPQEAAQGMLPGAHLIPVDELEARQSELPRDGRPMLIYCAAGGRSAAACEFLSRSGRDGLLNLAGGFGAWPGPRVLPGG
jgi:rhodanese-related sulfurtransferase